MPDTSLVRRARKIDRVLAETYPDATCELDFDNPFELLVVTVLSAQTTDKRVNAVRPALFAAYPDAAAMAAADRARLEELIQPTGFFRAKTESLLKLSQALVERYDGEVPGRLEDLVTLPGVGRKTANVVLGNAFGVPGITVDTHFGRLARRFGWTEETDPVKTEHAVGRAVPEEGLDDAQPPPDLARAAGLPRAEPGLRRLPGRPLVPVVRRGADRPGEGGEARPHRGSRMSPRGLVPSRRVRWRGAVAAALLPLALAACSSATPTAPGGGGGGLTVDVDVDTPALRAQKKAAGVEDCPAPAPGAPPRARTRCPTSSCPASAAGRT